MADNSNKQLFDKGRDFWNQNPCDGQSDVFKRMRFRYRKEPWLPVILEQSTRGNRVLEVGCGQGTDALYACSRKEQNTSYTALDCSRGSLQSAKASAQTFNEHLKVQPAFVEGNAECLPFPDNSFDCILSCGVLHHSPDTGQCIREVHRVLDTSGHATILLYRLFSPKILTALALRLIVRGIDRFVGKEGYVCDKIRRRGTNHFLGTMLLECAGVPVLRSYTRSGIRKMFSQFDNVSIKPIGMGFPYFGINHWIDSGVNPLGAFWLITATKTKPSLLKNNAKA